jgi:hypothetical protein
MIRTKVVIRSLKDSRGGIHETYSRIEFVETVRIGLRIGTSGGFL